MTALEERAAAMEAEAWRAIGIAYEADRQVIRKMLDCPDELRIVKRILSGEDET